MKSNYNLTELQSGIEIEIDHLSLSSLLLPCFIIRDEHFYLDGIKRKPGVWFCHVTTGKEAKQMAVRVCSPLHIEAVTQTERGQFGRMLRFRDAIGNWHKWIMPMALLSGSCEELRGVLLTAGVEIEHRHRNLLPDYIQSLIPQKVINVATRTGWTDGCKAFVLPDQVIGDADVHFNGETCGSIGVSLVGGSFNQWQNMAQKGQGNPNVIAAFCVSLAGPLLVKVGQDSGGIHFIGNSSTGKTTGLSCGSSCWGGKDFMRSWRTTSNGLEGVASMHSDTCLCLDEINEADPREVGNMVYSLGNGKGKTRATRVGSARDSNSWRLTILSTGEVSVNTVMTEGGKQVRAGQLVRLLNVPAILVMPAPDL